MNEFVKNFPQAWQEKWQEKGFQTPSLIQQAVFQPLKENQLLVFHQPAQAKH